MKLLEISSTQFTLQSERALEEIRARIMTFYGREDFEQKIRQFLESRNTSDFKSVRRELMDMVRARRLNIKNIVMAEKIDEAALWASIREIPTREQIKFDFIKELHRIYKKFPTSEKFLARIIRRSSNNEFAGDSLRLQILKLFVRNTNYHTAAIEKFILGDLTKSELDIYNSLDAAAKKEFLIKRLTEEIFKVPRADLTKTFNFIRRWFENNKPNFEIEEFTDVAEIQALSSNNDEKVISETEKNFCAYISKFNVIKNGEVTQTKEAEFLAAKINLIFDTVNFFDALEMENCVGQFAFTLKEYSALLVKLIKIFQADFQLSKNTKNELLKMARQLKLNVTATHSVQQILQAVAQIKNKINNNKKRTEILEKVEIEILASNKLNMENYRKFKSDLLKKRHAEFLITYLKKSEVNGKCGLDLKIWRDFLCRQVENFNLPPSFNFPAVSNDDKILTTLQNDLTLYLKNFRHKKESSYADIFRRALKDYYRDSGNDITLQNLAEDLTAANFRPQRIIKQQIYLLAFALDMDYDSFEKNLIQDFYSDNFLRYVESDNEKRLHAETTLLSEGINLKNYVEAIYVYFIHNRNLGTSAQRLEMAQATIEKCFNQTRKLFRSSSKDKAKVLKAAQLTDKYYSNRENFLNLKPEYLTDYICQNFYIYDPAVISPRIMMASEMHTTQEIFLELIDKIENSLSKNYGVSDAIISESIVDFEVGIDIEDLLDDLRKSNDSELLKISEDKNFVNLLRKLDTTLQVHQRGFLDRDYIKNQKFFSRTDLIAVYYFYFVNSILQTAIETFDFTNFETLYDKFVGDLDDEFVDDEQYKRLNYYLNQCHFHIFNPNSTSIFDNFILFALFLEIIR